MISCKDCWGTMIECQHVEIGIDTVYVRHNIERVTRNMNGHVMQMWHYDEDQYTLEEYEAEKVKIELASTKDALIVLEDYILEQELIKIEGV